VNRLIQRARSRGAVGALMFAPSLREEIAYRRGDRAEALDDANEAIELSSLVASASAARPWSDTGRA